MSASLSKLLATGVLHPIMQAGMPGIAGVELAAAVSNAGGIGTLGLQDVSVWEQRLQQLKTAAVGKPVNVNLLLPYTRRKHVDGVIREQIPLVTSFWGDAARLTRKLHRHGVFVFHQVGSKDEAAQALDAGVDAIIAQGSEAGGHVRGRKRLIDLLPEVVELAWNTPVFAAGGVYFAKDVRHAISLGASGVSTGTRFLLTRESNAHDEYKSRLLRAEATVVTRLFGLGWVAPHRVVRNMATDRWCRQDGSVPGWIYALNTGFSFTRKFAPFRPEVAARQRPSLPIFTPAALIKQLPGSLAECTALYAGEHVARLRDIVSAEAVVQELARGLVA